METPNANTSSEFTEIKGEIQGALFTIALPKDLTNWNRCVLIFLHGYREASIPLVADLDTTEYQFNQLLKNGWMIAFTSYRRGGIIIADAIKDVHNLRNYIVCEFGVPYQVILEARSMGGCIATHIAEQENIVTLYQGIVAEGAALLAKDPKTPRNFNYNPQIPILFLTNSSELGPIEQYIQTCRKNNATVFPALWEVSREGHNWINQEERYDAINNLLQWVHYGTFITRRSWNNTVIKAPQPSQVEFQHDSNNKPVSLTATVKSVSVWGSVITTVQPCDLEKLGIKIGRKFAIKTPNSNSNVEVTYSVYPFVDCSEGSWVCCEEPEGFVMFFTNGHKYKKDIIDSGLLLGEKLTVFAVVETKPKKLNKPASIGASHVNNNNNNQQ